MSRQQNLQPYVPSYQAEHTNLLPDQFDKFLESHGITLVHYTSAICPIGKTDQFDFRTHSSHPNCSNGFIYEKAGEVDVFFVQNQTDTSQTEPGLMDYSSVNASIPRYYYQEGNVVPKKVTLSEYDKFYLKDDETTVIAKQEFEHHQSGVDRLNYPAVDIEFLMDANGVKYVKDQHFVLDSGNIKWVSQTRPGYDTVLSRGVICSVRYTYKPYWYIKKLLHEIRVTRVSDPITGTTKIERMPYFVTLQREWVFEKENRSSNSDNTQQVVVAPEDGSFGPR